MSAGFTRFLCLGQNSKLLTVRRKIVSFSKKRTNNTKVEYCDDGEEFLSQDESMVIFFVIGVIIIEKTSRYVLPIMRRVKFIILLLQWKVKKAADTCMVI